MEVNNFGLHYEESSDPTHERQGVLLARLDESLADLSERRARRQEILAIAEASTPELRQAMNLIEADITLAIRGVTDILAEATLDKMIHFDDARAILQTYDIPVNAEPSAEYEPVLEALAVSTEVELQVRTTQTPERAFVDDTPTLFLMPTSQEAAMRAAIHLPVTFENGLSDGEIIRPRRSRHSGEMITPDVRAT